jgi:hypothetical protein
LVWTLPGVRSNCTTGQLPIVSLADSQPCREPSIGFGGAGGNFFYFHALSLRQGELDWPLLFPLASSMKFARCTFIICPSGSHLCGKASGGRGEFPHCTFPEKPTPIPLFCFSFPSWLLPIPSIE